MTRDEIKNTPELVDFLLDESIISDSRKKLHERMDKICNLAIKALEQQPCEDAISRQELLDAFWKLDIKLRPNAIDSILNMINDMSSVTPQQKTGYWEWARYGNNPDIGDWRCSECRCVVIEWVNKKSNSHIIPWYKYCPQCGAKMVEPQKSEDRNDCI